MAAPNTYYTINDPSIVVDNTVGAAGSVLYQDGSRTRFVDPSGNSATDCLVWTPGGVPTWTAPPMTVSWATDTLPGLNVPSDSGNFVELAYYIQAPCTVGVVLVAYTFTDPSFLQFDIRIEHATGPSAGLLLVDDENVSQSVVGTYYTVVAIDSTNATIVEQFGTAMRVSARTTSAAAPVGSILLSAVRTLSVA
jgi:hypothetical protein